MPQVGMKCVLLRVHLLISDGYQLSKHFYAGRGVSEKVSADGFCLGSGLFGSCNSN